MKTYIWTFPTRLFHWMVAFSFTLAFILGGEEKYLAIHAALGAMIGILVLFRIVQGATGPKYARFIDFPVSPASITFFITNMRQSKAAHPGHNPLASLVMISIFIMALLSAISGMLIFASGDTGMFGFRLNPGSNAELFEEFHDVVVHLFLILVGIHLTGIAVDTLFHKKNGTILSIFTGYKNLKAEPASLSLTQKIFSVFWFALPLMICFYVLLYQPVPADNGDNTEQVTESDKEED